MGASQVMQPRRTQALLAKSGDDAKLQAQRGLTGGGQRGQGGGGGARGGLTQRDAKGTTGCSVDPFGVENKLLQQPQQQQMGGGRWEVGGG